MRLFDEDTRTDLRSAKESEPRFHYYNQSARPSIVVLRGILERWFERYPDQEKSGLRGRFRSSNDSQHKSAFFELYIHELVTHLGFDLQVEPDVDGCGNHPDFLAHRNGTPKFYLEATLAGLPSEREYAAEKRTNIVYDAINTIDSPNFFLAIDIEGAPVGSPSTKELRNDLTRWLGTLDPDVIGKLYECERYAEIPSLTWQRDGWKLVFKPRPKSPEFRGKLGVRPIGLRMPTELEWLNTSIGIRRAVKAKAKQYGEFTLPFLIAINVVDGHCDNIDIMNALYGDEVTVVSQAPDDTLTERSQRKKNGAWYAEAGPRNTLVSGVLIGIDLHPWSMSTVTPELFLNPWALHPFSTADWPLPHCAADLQKHRVRHQAGKSAGEILGIPSIWPLPGDWGPARFIQRQLNNDQLSE